MRTVDLAQVLEAAPDAMVVVDARGLITLVNSQTEKVFGYGQDELIGQPIGLLLPERMRASHEADWASPPLATMGSGLDLPARRKDGTEFPVDILLSPLETKEGAMVISAIRDITARKDAERELRQLKTQLEERVAERTVELIEANKELDAFAHSVSHDLRAPLRAIAGFGEFLARDCADALDERGRGHLQRMMGATGRMNTLIDNLLQFARAARSDLRRVPVDLSALAQQVARDLQEPGSGRRVNFICAPGLNATGDLRLLRLMLVNLLGNAWKYTGKVEEPRVEFGLSGAGGESSFFLRDNGAGFDMRYVDRLFGTFQRLHSMAEFEGSGVGLATVRRIIHRHGGKIWAEAEVNKGAIFYFTLSGQSPPQAPGGPTERQGLPAPSPTLNP